jgi:hypothetical protein
MANSNTFILLILWMIIIMIGTSNTGESNVKHNFLLFQSPHPACHIQFDNGERDIKSGGNAHSLTFLSIARSKDWVCPDRVDLSIGFFFHHIFVVVARRSGVGGVFYELSWPHPSCETQCKHYIDAVALFIVFFSLPPLESLYDDNKASPETPW